jgi:hypothetical protein
MMALTSMGNCAKNKKVFIPHLVKGNTSITTGCQQEINKKSQARLLRKNKGLPKLLTRREERFILMKIFSLFS